MKKRLISIMLVLAVVLASCIVINTPVKSRAETTGKIVAGISVNFRSGPGTGYAKVKDNAGKGIVLSGGHKVVILDDSNSEWYKVSTTYNGVSYTGYIYAVYITRDVYISNDKDFEKALAEQGFPESYKAYLRELHALHPNWRFAAVHTNIEWNTLLVNEWNKSGSIKNLVWTSQSSPNYNWRSTSVNYNWITDKWTPCDGSNWFAASNDLVTYYLDPRTYLDETHIFAFESLSYQEGVYTIEGIEAILKGTFMSNAKAYNDTRTYSQLIMNAGKAAGVSPYHLAARIRLEMGTKAGQAANGSYNGCYNYYNIGATDTANGNPAQKGLKWAAESGSYGRPWNTVEKSITGGAQFLAASYISVGQDTLYTQKFNVTNKNSLFSHQYMSNVQSPFTESASNYQAYYANKMLDNTMLFEIPVYKNMPETVSVKPSYYGNPNYFLKTMTVSGYTLSPGFACNLVTDYSITVPEGVNSINISTTTVNANAKVSGVGTVSLTSGKNVKTITVTAQNGNTRKYTLTINRTGTPVAGAVYKGDMNGDGRISTVDIVKLQRIIVGLDELTSDNLARGDINGDGKISTIDIVKLQRHIVGLELIDW